MRSESTEGASLGQKGTAQWDGTASLLVFPFSREDELLIQWRKSLAASDARRRAPGLVGADHCVFH